MEQETASRVCVKALISHLELETSRYPAYIVTAQINRLRAKLFPAEVLNTRAWKDVRTKRTVIEVSCGD